MEVKKYDAFISYKQSSDIETAKFLLKNLEHFHIPSKFRKKIEKKHFKIFRDEDELRTSSNLNASLKEAISNSKFLIVLCSPESKNSSSILKEINYFIQTHGNSKENIIPVITKGTTKDAIPDILKEGKGHEYPLAADYRKPSDKSHQLHKIAATLIGCDYDELVQRNKSYYTNLITFIATIILIVIISLTYLIIKNIERHEENLRKQSENLVFLSENAYNNYDKEKAIQTSLEALLPSQNNKKVYVPEAKRALLTAIGAYNFDESEIEVIKNFNIHVEIEEYAIYTEGEGKYIAILGKDTNLYAYNIETGEKVLDVTFTWDENASTTSIHIVMCDENQLLFCSFYQILSFDLEKGKLMWWKSLNSIDISPYYINLSYNSDIITVALKSGEVLLLDKKNGEQIDCINLNKITTKTQEDKQIFAKISPDGHYMIYRNKSCIKLYDRKEDTFFTIYDGLQSKYGEVDEQIINNYYIFACTNGENKNIRILCYDMINKKITFEKEKEQMKGNIYIPRFIPFENVIINGNVMNITLCVIGNSMLLIDCQSSEIISEITLTNQIKGAFLQKYNFNFSKRDYGILSLGYYQDVLTIILENGECVDYSFDTKNIFESYKVFESGIIHPEKTKNYFLISYKNASSKITQDNVIYDLDFNIHTLKSEFFADSILIYGKKQANPEWKKITDDYDDSSNVYPYKNGFLIFQTKSCIYFDVKKESVIWENQDINNINGNNVNFIVYNNFFQLQHDNTYEYLGTDNSKQNILIGSFSSDFSYNIYFLNGENGSITRTDELNIEFFNNTPYKVQKISDVQNNNDRLYFAVKLEGTHGLIISYDLTGDKHFLTKIKLKNESSSIKISTVSHDGQYIFWYEQKENTIYLDECEQAAILNIKNEKLYPLEYITENIMLIPTPCWSNNDKYLSLRSNDQILIFSKTGDYKYSIETKEYTFVGLTFVNNILYVIGELNGIPMLYRYTIESGELIDYSELKGRSGFCGNTFDIECIKTYDSEIVMILHPNQLFTNIPSISFRIGIPFHNAYIIDESTGKSIAFIQQGTAYNSDIDYLFANQGIIKRYTTEELIKKASKAKEIL